MDYNKYHVRITFRENLSQNMVVDFFSKLKCVGGLETGKSTDKPHAHFHVEEVRSMEAFRMFLKRGLKLDGNEDYQISRDKGKSLEYCIKEKNILVNTLFTEDELVCLLEKAYNSKETNINRRPAKRLMKDDIIEKYVPLILEEEEIFTIELRGRISRHVWSYLRDTEFPRGLYYNRQNIEDIFSSIIASNYRQMKIDIMISTMNNTMGNYTNF